MTKSFVSVVRHCLAGLCVWAVGPMAGVAAVDVCQQPLAYSNLSVGFYPGAAADLEDGPGEVEQKTTASELQFRLNDDWSVGAGHQYTVLDFDQLDLQTNGDLHTFYFPVHWQHQFERTRFRFSVAPAMSASSNVMKDPAQYDADAVQLLAAAEWGRSISESTDLRYGLCGDHRFGSYKVYPLVSLDWQPHANWTVALGFPTTALHYRAGKRFDSVLRVTPNGNEWYVKDKSLQYHSQLIYQSYLLELALNWRLHERLTLTASVGRQFDNQYEMTLLDGSRVQVSSEPFTRLGAALGWRF